MGEYPDFGTPDRWQSSNPFDADADTDAEETELSQQSKQEIAHDRGRICKKRGCVVCAPLREQRREKKKARKAEAQAALHARNKPCGRASCEIDICVRARAAAATATPAPRPDTTHRSDAAGTTGGTDTTPQDPGAERRRQEAKHRLGLPCGSQDCMIQLCVDGFANERTRRHRAGRPCRSATCETPICVAARTRR